MDSNMGNDKANCPNCQAEYQPGDGFCPKCGANLKEQSTPQVVQHVHHHEAPTKRSGMHPCALVGMIFLGVTMAIVIISFVGCVGCASLFTAGTMEVSKQMELAADRESNPSKYTSQPSGIEVVSAQVVEDRYSEKIKIVVKNNSEQVVSSVVVHVKTENEYGESGIIFDVTKCKVVEPDKPLGVGETASGLFYHTGNKNIAEATINRALFADGSTWPDDYFIEVSPDTPE